ncbi:MAG: RagB/SusD family nutrient uptake outer membrane protein [Chitinophagaceae bacterium]|nr:RagB/SusD family nutrient uptake outer membrane protein [Chitinophagaceae bacterium]
MIEVDLPVDRYTSETVYANVATAVPAVNSVYALMAHQGQFSGPFAGVSLYLGLISDDIINVEYAQAENQNIYDGSGDYFPGYFWKFVYKDIIYQVHSSLEGVNKSSTLPVRAKQILSGELKFTRAWLYFLLVNLYGDVPLVLSTDFKVNSIMSRTPKDQVYDQIITDLLEAQTLLEDNFLEKDLVNTGIERIRPNKAAAAALLARVYLYKGKWQEAEAEASKVITNSNYELLSNLDEVFLKNSKETILALQPSLVNPDGVNSPEGAWPITPDGGNDPNYVISPFLLNTFEVDDQRKLHWISSTESGRIFTYKYKQGSRTMESKEYTVVFRLAEQFLIRAEARAMQGKLTGENSAVSDINVIRNRAGLANSVASTEQEILVAIDKERQTELFMEWGDRWLNMKRRGTVDDVMSVVTPEKGGVWEPYKALFPIPWDEFMYNPGLAGHQNPGYTER